MCMFHTVTSVAQVRPDDVFLREAENAESPASHSCVDHNARVGHHVCSLKQLHSEGPRTLGYKQPITGHGLRLEDEPNASPLR